MKTKLPCGHEVDLSDEIAVLNHLASHQPPNAFEIQSIEQMLGYTYDSKTNTFQQQKGNTK